MKQHSKKYIILTTKIDVFNNRLTIIALRIKINILDL